LLRQAGNLGSQPLALLFQAMPEFFERRHRCSPLDGRVAIESNCNEPLAPPQGGTMGIADLRFQIADLASGRGLAVVQGPVPASNVTTGRLQHGRFPESAICNLKSVLARSGEWKTYPSTAYSLIRPR